MVNRKGNTVLHALSAFGLTHVIQLLLNSGAHSIMRQRKNHGDTVLHTAAEYVHADTVALLLGFGLLSSETGTDGRTPLHVAATHNRVSVVQVLLDHGAAIDAQNDADETALHLLARDRLTETGSLLLERGANISVENEFGENVLHNAARHGATGIVLLMAERACIDIDAKKENGLTPATDALSCLVLFEYLFQWELPHWKSKAESLDAWNKRNMEAVSILLDRGADVKAQSSKGWSALHYAAALGDVQSASRILEKSTDVEPQDDDYKAVKRDKFTEDFRECPARWTDFHSS
jgi:ankyrin repeat protein